LKNFLDSSSSPSECKRILELVDGKFSKYDDDIDRAIYNLTRYKAGDLSETEIINSFSKPFRINNDRKDNAGEIVKRFLDSLRAEAGTNQKRKIAYVVSVLDQHE
jgi:hypothetical protein